MKIQKLTTCIFFLCILFSGYERVKGSSVGSQLLDYQPEFKPRALFVFGDSYADTGNNPMTNISSWKFPYGITFPGNSSGRYSDGRVSTDYFAKYLQLRPPIPYRWRRSALEHLTYGMNFAYGGAGVFETVFNKPNTTMQIDNFEQLLHEKVYSTADLNSSVALFSIAGNDYFTYAARNNSNEDPQTFITNVVNQLVSDVNRIRSLGVRKVAVAALPPLGCLPILTRGSGFRQCNETFNTAVVEFHNGLLSRALMKLNLEKKETDFVMLDIYNAFLIALEDQGVPGIANFPDPLGPCCEGTKEGGACGKVDKNGVKLYKLCKDPKSFFFWDDFHPSNEAWRAVYSLLLPNFTF